MYSSHKLNSFFVLFVLIIFHINYTHIVILNTNHQFPISKIVFTQYVLLHIGFGCRISRFTFRSFVPVCEVVGIVVVFVVIVVIFPYRRKNNRSQGQGAADEERSIKEINTSQEN